MFDGPATMGGLPQEILWKRLNHASRRCLEVSKSERLMGFNQEADYYFDLASELLVSAAWARDIVAVNES